MRKSFMARMSLPNRTQGHENLKQWIAQAIKHKVKGFHQMAYTIEHHLDNITNFFMNRSTNASAEAFNAKVKQFRAIQRGVSDTDFFLFRLSKIYA
ncbi:MAG: transposase [Cyclonatronaceae bacterium]